MQEGMQIEYFLCIKCIKMLALFQISGKNINIEIIVEIWRIL